MFTYEVKVKLEDIFMRIVKVLLWYTGFLCVLGWLFLIAGLTYIGGEFLWTLLQQII